MELIMHQTSRSNQPPFKVYNVKEYKSIGSYTVEVEFNDGNKESFYAIDSVEVIGSEPKFELHSQWYYINNKGFIEDFIVHSGLSPSNAEILAGIYKVYSDWSQAKEALDKYNKVFKTFKEYIND
mgnify:CR=1 FL=1